MTKYPVENNSITELKIEYTIEKRDLKIINGCLRSPNYRKKKNERSTHRSLKDKLLSMKISITH